MSAVEMSKDKVLEQIRKVSAMNQSELEDHKRIVSSSNADGKAKGFIYKAIDLRQEELQARNNSLAVNGDLDDFKGNM